MENNCEVNCEANCANNNEIVTLEKDTTDIETTANSIVITNQATYENAVEFTKKIKEATKKVTDYWKPSKEASALAHKSICQKEKDMLTPLKEAETILKSKITTYVAEQERIRQEKQRRIKEEQERLALEQLQKAEELQKQGNNAEAIAIEANAMAISQLETKVESNVGKVDGISYQKSYEVVITDAKKVPSYINGIEIRPVDISQIKKLVKMTNNTLKIDGIEVKETKIAKIKI